MQLTEKEIKIPRPGQDVSLIGYFEREVGQGLPAGALPVSSSAADAANRTMRGLMSRPPLPPAVTRYCIDC